MTNNKINVLVVDDSEDGAAELKLMRDKGAITIAQDLESSIVHGMPGEAILLSGATHVLAAGNIAGTLIALVRGGQTAGEIERSMPV
jgi:two-component system chemotaxis response regulator CheB